MQTFTNIRTLIIDMDGVLWHGQNAIPGLVEFFQALEELKISFILATNNASSTSDQYVKKLAEMGVSVNKNQILTSGIATALYLSEKVNPANTRVFVVGEEGAKQPLIDQGFTLTALYEVNKDSDIVKKGADFVVCGKDHTLTWDKLATATLNIRAGAQFIGTNGDTTLPTELGITHGNGATIIGKPEPIMYQQALALLNAEPTATVAIGDRLDTDILGAVRTGIRSVMVLTGVSTQDDLKDSDFQPTWVMSDIGELTKALRKQHEIDK